MLSEHHVNNAINAAQHSGAGARGRVKQGATEVAGLARARYANTHFVTTLLVIRNLGAQMVNHGNRSG